MSIDRGALARHLRQLTELGERDLFLDELTAAEALALLRSEPAGEAARQLSEDAAILPGVHIAEPTAGPGTLSPTRPIARAPQRPIAQTPPQAPAPGSALHVLGQQAGGCTACRLHETRTTVVFGEGNPDADVMVVGEAPGQEEDRTGRPFVGQAGKLLDLLLMTAGFPRSSVYICNTLKCRPPQNRNPLPDEMAACAGFLNGQIDAVKPRAMIAVGRFAIMALLQTDESVGKLRGRIHSYRGTPLIVTYHPAYLLRDMKQSRLAWQDFQLLRQVVDEQA